MAILYIDNLRVNTIVGIKKSERIKKQEVLIHAEIEYDATRAIETDNISYGLDYDALVKTIIEKIQKESFYLIEKLAYSVLGIIISNGKVRSAKVKVVKPKAVKLVGSVSVELKSGVIK